MKVVVNKSFNVWRGCNSLYRYVKHHGFERISTGFSETDVIHSRFFLVSIPNYRNC
jgi:hypothetical protein